MIEYILIIFYILLILYIFKKNKFFKNIAGLSYPWIVGFFLVKVLTGIILSLIYKYYYDPQTSDIYKYFNDGIYLYNILYEKPVDYLRLITGIGITEEHANTYLSNLSYWYRPWESPLYNDNRVIIRFNALVGIFSFGHLHVHTIFSNLISFTGLIALYKYFLNYISKEKIFLLKWGIFLFPSLLFWGSGILKEAILIGCFGMAVYVFDNMLQYNKLFWIKTLLFLICLWVMVLLKPYILVLFLPCIAGFYISKDMHFIKKQLVYVSMLIALLIPIYLLHIFLPEFDPIRLIARKQNDLINLSVSVDAGSLLHENFLKPCFFNIIRNAPGAFLTTLLRPHIFEASNIFMVLSSVENLLIKILMLISILTTGSITKQKSSTWLSLWFFLVGFIFIGLATPVAGAIVRYKIIMLPFIWVFVINILNVQKVKNWLYLRL